MTGQVTGQRTARRRHRRTARLGIAAVVAIISAGVVVAGPAAIASTATTSAPAPQISTSSSPTAPPTPAPATPDPTPDPQPGAQPQAPTPDPGGGADDGSGEPGFFDISGRVREAINGWLAGLVDSALNPILRLIGRTLLATPDLTSQPRIRQLWTGSAVAANSLFVLFIVVGGWLVMAHQTLQSQYSIKEIAPRLAIAVTAANLSLQLAGRAIEFVNALTMAVVGEGLDPDTAGERLTQLIVGSVRDGGSFLLLLGLVTAVLGLMVAASYVVRVAVTLMLLVTAPLFLICHGSPATEAAAFFWWRAVAGCFAVQLGQAATLMVAVRVFLTPEGFNALGLPEDSSGLVNLLVAICLLWILARIPTWLFRSVFHGRRSTVIGVVRTVLIARGLQGLGVLPSRGAKR